VAAVNDQTDELLTVGEAAAICRVSSRTIRRALAAGAFPNARKSSGEAAALATWHVPIGDLERAGLCAPRAPERAPVATAAASREAARADIDETARLRSELAESVATAELMLMRERMEKWRAIATERERALERADATLAVLSEAVISMARATGDANDDTPVVAWPPSPSMANVPPEVRETAMRYATARDTAGAPRRWWQTAR